MNTINVKKIRKCFIDNKNDLASRFDSRGIVLFADNNIIYVLDLPYTTITEAGVTLKLTFRGYSEEDENKKIEVTSYIEAYDEEPEMRVEFNVTDIKAPGKSVTATTYFEIDEKGNIYTNMALFTEHARLMYLYGGVFNKILTFIDKMTDYSLRDRLKECTNKSTDNTTNEDKFPKLLSEILDLASTKDNYNVKLSGNNHTYNVTKSHVTNRDYFTFKADVYDYPISDDKDVISIIVVHDSTDSVMVNVNDKNIFMLSEDEESVILNNTTLTLKFLRELETKLVEVILPELIDNIRKLNDINTKDTTKNEINDLIKGM